MNLKQIDNDFAMVRVSSSTKEETNILRDEKRFNLEGDNTLQECCKESHLSNHSNSFKINKQESKVPSSVSEFKKGQFKILKQVGQGSFCEVHKAWYETSEQAQDQQEFAIKHLKRKNKDADLENDQGYADLIKETELLSSLHHENIITFHGRCTDQPEGHFFFVMELLTETLDKRLRKWAKQQKNESRLFLRNKWLDDIIMHRVENVALGIIRGMEYLHSKNIMHRDLKPSNVGFDEQDEVKIFDFGLSREYQHHRHETGQTADLMMSRRLTLAVGTPRYMAPELARSEHNYDLSVDIYSFGILFWQLLTNRLPYHYITTSENFISKVAVGGKRPPLRCIREKRFQNLCNICWSANARDRPTFTCIRNQLETFIES